MSDGNLTLVWMTNRDEPVNGKRSKFSLLKTGNLVLTDAGRKIWRTNTKSSNLQLKLLDFGNLVLIEFDDQSYLWQSFSFPTDTILSDQPFTNASVLVSSRSSTNLSTFNNSRFALLDSKGRFKSTDNLTFIATDYGQIIIEE
ncbi:hypothetical protein L6452_39047 [Arctium lappa]|uniref:Uncharacterized protein n=1 Tax=Arctium lappa TaxID=4217 RepID=A0ACB8XR77_ARCLA|nr:hypothetical protein L6452_39047 [Arctium lappa]